MKRALAVTAVAVWVAAIVGAYLWSVNGSGWAVVNAVIVAGFGLVALVPALRWIWRREPD